MMKMAQMQSNYRRRSHWCLWLGLLLLFLTLALTHSVWGVFKRSQIARRSTQAVKIENEELLQRKKQLSNQVEALNTVRGIEEEIRRNFSVTKEGEKVIVVVEPTATETVVATSSWWQGILDRF